MILRKHRREAQKHLAVNSCAENPYKPLSKKEILKELAKSRECCMKGEDFDQALDEIGAKYRL